MWIDKNESMCTWLKYIISSPRSALSSLCFSELVRQIRFLQLLQMNPGRKTNLKLWNYDINKKNPLSSQNRQFNSGKSDVRLVWTCWSAAGSVSSSLGSFVALKRISSSFTSGTIFSCFDSV